jgi:heat shock protein HslJ
VSRGSNAEPHLVFDGASRRVTGSGGCNLVTGGYEVSGDKLALDRMTGTMMACVEGMETEQAFLQSLGQVTGWRIEGRHLDLLDATGSVLAGFEPGR